MNLLNITAKRSAIGIELDTHEFRAVQLVRDGNRHRVHAWAVFPRLGKPDDAQAETVGAPLSGEEMRWALSILWRRGFKGNLVSCAPRPRDCTQHVFELPPPESGAPLEQLARVEVARARKSEPNAFEFGFWALPQRGRTSESMAVACPSGMIRSIIESYESGGLEVAGIDLPELAIMRGVLDTPTVGIETADPEIDTILLVGWNSSLAVVTLGHRIVYVRRIAHGARCVWELARNRYGLNEKSASLVLDSTENAEHAEQIDKVRSACWSGLSKELASEIDVAIAYVSHSFRTAPLGSLVTCGYGATNKSLFAKFDSVLGIPVIVSEPAPLLEAMPSGHDPSLPARLTYAYGLAARFDS